MSKKVQHLVFVLVLIASLLSGCSGETAQPAGTQKSDGSAQASKVGETIRVGVLFPLTGPLALLGNDAFDAIGIIADMVNEQGGANGRKIQLVKADAPDATAATNEANRLIKKENVPVILGTYASGLSMAATQVAERNQVAYVEANGVTDSITSRGYKYLMRVTNNASMHGAGVIGFVDSVLVPKLGIQPKDVKLVIMHEDSAFGTSVAEAVEKRAKEAGFQILSKDSYKSTTNDLSSTILKYKQLNPDIVIATSYINDAVLFVKQSKQLEFKPKAIVGTAAGYGLPDFAQKLGADANGIFVAEAPTTPNPKALTENAIQLQQEFVKRWKSAKGSEPTGITWSAVNAAWVLFHEALPQAKTLDANGIRDALLAVDIQEGEMPNGIGVKFNGPQDKQAGQNERAKVVMMQWQNGEFKLVWPDKFANTEPVQIPLYP